MKEKFNLLDEPWILLRQGAKIKEASLRDALLCAHEYHALAGELPTQDAAVLRVLLAALYAIFTCADENGAFTEIENYEEAVRRWNALWRMARFPSGQIDAYLDAYRERFWLLHPQAPFMQTAGIETAGNTINPIAQIIAHVPSREERRFFTELSGDEAQRLTFARAARWLIHMQAFDYAGKKASVVGGAPNGGGTGWCGKLGLVYPIGKNLFETLLLNLVFAESSGRLLAFGKPAWEEPPKTAAKKELRPKSYTELLTWQSRRVRLFCEGAGVTGVISSYGDVFDKEDTLFEQMSGWHKSSQSGRGYIPTTHTAGRRMWRDLAALLPQVAGDDKTTRPGVLDWLGLLDIKGKIDVCAVGYEYGAMQADINEMIADAVTLNARLLTDLGNEWIVNILQVLDDTEKAVDALGLLASDLDKAAGGDGTGAGEGPKDRAYFALDEPFRAWLAEIAPAGDRMLETCNRWKGVANRILSEIGRELTRNAGNAAFVGRPVKESKKPYYMSSAIADMKFEAALKRILGGDAKSG